MQRGRFFGRFWILCITLVGMWLKSYSPPFLKMKDSKIKVSALVETAVDLSGASILGNVDRFRVSVCIASGASQPCRTYSPNMLPVGGQFIQDGPCVG